MSVSASRPTTTSSFASGPSGYGRCSPRACASTATSGTRTSRPHLGTRSACGSCSAEPGDLLDGKPQLVVRVEEMRPDAKARLGTAVDEDPALRQLRVDAREVRSLHDHGAAAPLGLAGAARLEPRL